MLLLLTLNILCTLFYLFYYWIWTNECQLGLRNHSFRQLNLFSVTTGIILIYGPWKFVRLNVFTQKTGCERINFHYNTSKRLVEPCIGIVLLVFSKFWHGARNLYQDVCGRARFFWKKILPQNWKNEPRKGQKQAFLNLLKN